LNLKIIEGVNITSTIVFLLGCIGLIAVIVFDRLYWGTGVIAEGWPNFSAEHIVRSITIFISTFAMLWSLIGSSRPKLVLNGSSGMPIEQLSILGVLFTSVVIVFLFIFKPLWFNALSYEDGIIEWGSAMLLFGSCIIAAITFSKSRNVSNLPNGTRLSIAFLSLVFFLIAMEEVSWFQRVLEIETPRAFNANLQYEFNLHNFYTNPIENIYYFGVFLFLVAFPFVRLLFPCISDHKYLRIFVARPFIGVIGTIACAYNFDMWNGIFTQIAFFGSVLILFVFFVFSSYRNERYIILFTILLIVATQVIFLTNGVNFAREWEVTEYKEFFIPLALFIYSLDMFTYMKHAQFQ